MKQAEMGDKGGRSWKAPVSKKEDRSLILWVTVNSEGISLLTTFPWPKPVT